MIVPIIGPRETHDYRNCEYRGSLIEKGSGREGELNTVWFKMMSKHTQRNCNL